IVEFTATVHDSARPGAMALVEWTVLGADRVSISNGAGAVHETSKTEGKASLPVGFGGFFEIRAYAGSVVVQGNTSIQIETKPLIRSLTTGPLVTAGQGVAGVTTLGWGVGGPSKSALVVQPGGLVGTASKSPREDGGQVLVVGPGTVALTAQHH